MRIANMMASLQDSWRDAVGGLPRMFWYLWAGTLINRVGVFVVPFLSLFLTRHRGLSIEHASWIVAVFGLGSFVAQLLGGWLADRIGRRRTMLLSFVLTPILTLALFLSEMPLIIGIVTLLFGLCADLYRPASSATVADIVPTEKRGQAFTLVYWAINLGSAMGLALGGLLAERSYGLLFIGDALTTAMFAVVVYLFIVETKPPRSIQSTMVQNRRLSSEWYSMNTRFVLLIAFLLFLYAVIYGQAMVTLPLDMIAHGLSSADYGLAGSLNGLLIVLVSLPLSHFLRRYGRFVSLSLGMVVLGVGFGLNAFASSVLIYGVAVLIWTIGELMVTPLISAVIADISPVDKRGLYQGISGAGYGLGNFISPIVGGWLFGHFGGGALWLGCMVLSVATAIGHWTLARPFYNSLIQPEATV